MIGTTFPKLIVGTPEDNQGPNPTPWVHVDMVQIAPGTIIKLILEEGARVLLEGGLLLSGNEILISG